MSRQPNISQSSFFLNKVAVLVFGVTLIVAAFISAPTNASRNVPVTDETTQPLTVCTPEVLWNQIGNLGTNGTNSQDFETANNAFDSESREDFTVTPGQTWTIQKIVARGIYFNGFGPADSFNVKIGSAEFNGLSYIRNVDDFEISLPTGVTLQTGTYWASVQAKMDFTPGGQWAWANREQIPFSFVAQWRNPGGGYAIPQCLNFANRGAVCGIDPSFPEQAFRLEGLILGGSCTTPTATATPSSTASGSPTYTPTSTPTGTPSARTAFDYDGDRKADVSVFRPTDGAWYIQQSQAGLFGTLFGFGTDKIAPADYDGDGKTDIAVYRPSTGIWYVLKSSDGTVEYFVFGLSEDLPTPADYDGDGEADVSVYRPSTGTWYRQNSSNGSYTGIQFGASEDKPTIGDFDGDGKSDIAVFRPSTGAWYWINSSDSSIYGELFGFGTDIITPADYDGDGKTDLAAYRPTDGIWYLKYSSNASYDYKVFGLANDIPAPADFDGDGKADICVFRPSDGNWYRQNSSNGAFTAFQFGANGDKPTMTAFRY